MADIDQPIQQPYLEDSPLTGKEKDERSEVTLKAGQTIVARVRARGDHSIERAGFVIRENDHDIRFISIPVDPKSNPFELVKELQFNLYKYIKIRFS